MKLKKLLSFCSAFLLAVSPLCVPMANAESNGNILLAGDSIASGFGLAENQYSYGQIIGEYLEYDVTNAAVPGLTSAQLAAMTESEEFTSAVSNADIILVSIGGNDFLHVLDQVGREIFPDYNMEELNIKELFNYLEADINVAIKFAPKLDTAIALQIPKTLENIQTISEKISQVNPDAKIVFQTLYDPFQISQQIYDNYFENDLSYKTAFLGVKRAVYFNLKSFNKKLADSIGDNYLADVEKSFTSDEIPEDLTLPYGHTPYFVDTLNPEDTDIHPNQRGHLEIASTVLETLGEEPNVNRTMRSIYHKLSAEETALYPELRIDTLKKYADAPTQALKGDYNDDKTINASDASDVLSYYASISAGEKIEFTKDKFVSLDVNGDDIINASDASAILAHYASISAGESDIW